MTSDPDTLNVALAMSLEWGPVRMTPLRERLKERVPEVTDEHIAELERQSGAIESVAWREIERAYLKETTMEAAGDAIRTAFPPISSANISSLYAQGQYYAWHDNG